MRLRGLPGLLVVVAGSGLVACDGGGGERRRTTVERERPVASVGIDGVDDIGVPDIDVDDDLGVEAVAEAETMAETEAEVETVAETEAVAEIETETETVAETVAETSSEVVDTTPDTVIVTDIGPEPGVGEACQIGGVVGECRHVADCEVGEVAAEGFCAGGTRVRCCVPAWERCSAKRAPGACLSTADCPAPSWQSTSGLCPGPADVRCCTSTTSPPLCDPAVRPTPNDGLVEAPGDPGCLPGMARISAATDFCIDRFEASLVLAADPTVSLSPWHNPGSTAVRAVSIRWAVPQGYIDQLRAKAACQAAGKRLCTSDEWLHTCRGDAAWTYPYGATRQDGVCNDDRRMHVAFEYFGTSESWVFSEIDNACLSQLPASLDLAGENEGCQTPTGVYDLMGNLHEWIDDPAGTFRGGFFDDTRINGEGCLYRTTAHDVSHWDYSTGFRCCADPAP